MDRVFELKLLKMLDDLLQEEASWETFLAFTELFPQMFSGRFNDELRFLDAPDGSGGAVKLYGVPEKRALVQSMSDAVLPHERAQYFAQIAERVYYTIPEEPDEQSRRYGYGNLVEFIELVRRARERYRIAFGV